MLTVIENFMEMADLGKPVMWMYFILESMKKIIELRITVNSVEIEYRDNIKIYNHSNPGYIAFAFWLAIKYHGVNVKFTMDDETKKFIESTSKLLDDVIKIVAKDEPFAVGQCWFKSQLLDVLTVLYPEHKVAIKKYKAY